MHMPCGFKKLTIRKTREQTIGYVCIEPGLWRFVDLQPPIINNEVPGTRAVGPFYGSKAELLADCERYLKDSWGL